MSNASICSSCLRTLHRQTRRQISHQKPSAAYQPQRAFTTATSTSYPQSTQAKRQDDAPSKSPSTQSSLLQSLRNSSALRSTTEPYVAYGATETLFVNCAKTCSYTIPQANEKPPRPAPKNEAGEDVGVGEGWWFAPKTGTNPGLELPVTFNTWAQVMYLHMYALTVRLRKFPAEHVRTWEQNLLDHFSYAAEDRMAMWHGMSARGIRNKYLKDLWLQWRGVLLSYDEGLIKGDAVLGAAVWRNVFSAREDVNLADVAAVVAYLRREIRMLDGLEDHVVAAGNVKFGLLKDEGKTLAQRSPWMNKNFTEEDLAALQGAGQGRA